MNLLEETVDAITHSGHTEKDIVFIGSFGSGHECSWVEFKVLADVEYDNGYGASAVATDLRIVFSGGQQMWRGEYDGSEWWEYSTPFVKGEKKKKITRLFIRDDQVGWKTLEEIHDKKT